MYIIILEFIVDEEIKDNVVITEIIKETINEAYKNGFILSKV